jgi:SAM-dependent methyltransferase
VIERLLDPMADVNYEYFLSYIKRIPEWRSLRVLDYGCGNGDLIRYLRNRGINCYGTDLPHVVAAYDELRTDLRQGGIVKPLLPSGRVPFLMKFDLVISNQVIEHVNDLETVLENMLRVLKPNGIMHHHFPCKETIRESHIGIPFAHWFPKGKTRFLYTFLLRCLGLGYHKAGHENFGSWTMYKLNWIDNNCAYRDFQEIFELITKKYNCRVISKEMDYIDFRCKPKPLLNNLLKIDSFKSLYEYLFRRLGFRVIDLVPQPSSLPRV